MKCATKRINITHLTLGMLPHYLGKLKMQILCRYSADMEENANKLHFKQLLLSEIRLTTSLLCTPSNTNFLLKSCTCRRISCWLLTNAAVTSAVTNFWCHKLIAKVITYKNSDMENFVCNQYGERQAVLNTENIKIYGWITNELEAIIVQFVCIFFHIC